MLWADSACFALKKEYHDVSLQLPGLLCLGGLFLSAIISFGFLYIVGFTPISICFAMTPYIVTLLLLTCIGFGYLWELVDRFGLGKETLPPISPFKISTLLIEGFQLVFFYFIVLGFLIASTFLLYPYGIIIPILVLIFHPLLVVPALCTAKDKTFLGLMDACLDVGEILKQNYFTLWLEMTLFWLIVGAVIYPILLCLSVLSMVGLFLIPGLSFSLLIGYVKLSVSLCRNQIQKFRMLNTEEELEPASVVLPNISSPFTKSRSFFRP